MTSHSLKKIRCVLALLASGAVLAGVSAAAQTPPAGQFQEDPGTALTRHLRTLADQPSSIDALKGAGRAALALGDPQAALTFFARAEEIVPRDGRVKAGMGSAFIQMEQPREAMKFFDEARSLGVPEAEFAGDRGLVYDLNGETRRAQADYNLALRWQEDPEVRRRLALSLAISGDRDRAIQTIDAQLRQQDRAAWRVRAFILALTGDVSEATRAVEAAMPWQAAEMRPFLARLPSLSPAQRAMAVHFGNMPAGGQPVRVADASSPAVAAPVSAAPPVPSTATNPRRTVSAAPVSTAPRRRPGEAEKANPPERTTVDAGRISGFDLARGIESRRTVPKVDRPTQVAEAKSKLPVQVAEARPAPPVQYTVPSEPSATGATQPVNRPSSAIVSTALPPSTSVQSTADAGATAPPVAPRVDVAPAATASASDPAPRRPGPNEEAPKPGFASVAALVAGLAVADAPSPPRTAQREPEAVPFKKAVPAQEPAKPVTQKALSKTAAAKPTATEKPDAAAKKDAASKKAEAAKPKAPSRIWVQVAGGADKKALPREFSRLKAKAPKLLARTSAWTTPLRATNRLLVGPFKTEKEAQALVNELNKLDFSAFSWTSPAGQEIEKLGAQ